MVCFLFMLTCLVQAQSIDWEKLKERSEYCLGLINTDLELAEALSDSLLEQAVAPYDSLVLSKIWVVKANVSFQKGMFDQSAEYNLKALKIRELIRDSNLIVSSLGNLGNVFYQTGDLEKAITYHQQSIELKRMMKQDVYVSARNYNTIGLIYLEMMEYDSSRKYFEEGIQACVYAPEKYQKSKAMLYSNKATLEEEEGNITQSIADLKVALNIHQQINRVSSLAWTYYRIGVLNLDRNQLDSGLFYLQKAIQYAESSSTLDQKREINYSLFQCYLQLGIKDSALHYADVYTGLDHIILEEKTKESIQDAEAKYQLEKKEAINAKLEAEKETQRYYLYWALTGVLTLLILLFFGYRYYRGQQKLANLELEIKDSKLDELLSDQESKTYASVLRGQEKERERIAQDLHDRLGGTLAALKHTLKKPENNIDPEDLKIIDQAVLEVRSIAHNLSTGLVSKYGLNEALSQLFRAIEKTGGISFNLYIHPKISSLGQAIGMELYRIVQELVSNTLKHAEATEVSLQTNFDIGSFNFIFEDNGRGFDAAKVKGGIGLENIRARVDKLGGELHIDTQPGRGTIVIIELKQRV